jgi:3-hydroxypropanoate dehydrogenase
MLDAQAIDLLFRNSRTHNVWLDRPVTDAQLRAIHDIMKWGPTSANCQPMRVVFVRSKEAKDKLAPALGPNNLDKTMKAPATAIIAHDSRFYEHLPRMFAHNQTAKSWFDGAEKKALAEATAFRNGSLQGAYFIVAARAVGLDCGPMSGFDSAKVDAAFFPDGRYKSNFLVNLGHGDKSKLMPRNQRFEFDEVCRVV